MSTAAVKKKKNSGIYLKINSKIYMGAVYSPLLSDIKPSQSNYYVQNLCFSY